MELNEIERIFEKFEKSSISEMELEAGQYRLFLKRNVASPVSQNTISQTSIPLPQSAESKADVKDVEDGKAIKAPLVGTFYRASAPGKAPYVEIGDSVKKGDVVGLIEAMKFMNEITAPADGVVKAIPAEDGAFVEFDETLVLLDA